MNFFEDLITDLQKENLLDNGINVPPKFNDSWFSQKQNKSESISNEFSVSNINSPNLKEIFPENFSINQSQNDSIDENHSCEPLNYNPLLLLHPVKPMKPVNKMRLKPKTRGRFCKTCMISVPYHRINCKFCGEHVKGGAIYYTIVILSALAVIGIFYFIIANKTYN